MLASLNNVVPHLFVVQAAVKGIFQHLLLSPASASFGRGGITVVVCGPVFCTGLGGHKVGVSDAQTALKWHLLVVGAIELKNRNGSRRHSIAQFYSLLTNQRRNPFEDRCLFGDFIDQPGAIGNTHAVGSIQIVDAVSPQAVSNQ